MKIKKEKLYQGNISIVFSNYQQKIQFGESNV